MFNNNSSNDMTEKEKAIKCFDNVRETLKGIIEILRISFSPEDLYFKLAQDNIIVLYNNLIELIQNENGIKEIKKRINNCEINFDISFNDTQ
ncbi:MAG TPA: hypothetical protein VGB37_05665 [Candidatus Lokiarchaeia archaeon]